VYSGSSSSYPSHIHHVVYPDDDYAHILGIGDSQHKPSKLQVISALRLKDVAQSKAPVDTQGCGFDPTFFVSAEDLEAEIVEFDKAYGTTIDLSERIASVYPRMAIAAEFKRASPSKGDINPNVDAVDQCLQYSKVGAAVISVLTEYTHFKGTLTDMKRVRIATQADAVKENKPRPAILRKDFILDKYQILEARANGADTILLIVAILGVQQLRDLMAFSRSLGMEPLVEVHTDREMGIALDCKAKVIGVNNRNLHTFQLDMDTTSRAIAVAKSRNLTWRPSAAGSSGRSDVSIAALSGITSRQDVVQFRQEGVSCCLIGETLMKSADPRATVEELLAEDDELASTSGGVGGGGSKASTPLVKTCGMTSVSDAEVALQAGSNMLGVIFVPSSPRAASVEQAKAIVATARRYGERTEGITFAKELAAMRADRLTSKLWFSRMGDVLKKTTLRTPLVVGVFQDQSADEINDVVRKTNIDVVQLHGDEQASLIDQIIVPCIKVLHISPSSSSTSSSSSSGDIANALMGQVNQFSGKVLALLLDSRLPGSKGGGTGSTFDWQIASNLQGVPVLLAGGLSADNVAQAVVQQGVLGVDVSSGVEVAKQPGVKDLALLKAFISNAKR